MLLFCTISLKSPKQPNPIQILEPILLETKQNHLHPTSTSDSIFIPQVLQRNEFPILCSEPTELTLTSKSAPAMSLLVLKTVKSSQSALNIKKAHYFPSILHQWNMYD